MLKTNVLPLAAVATFIILVGLFTQKQSFFNFSKYIAIPTPPPPVTVKIDGKTLNVEVANTQDLRSKGLSGRSSIPVNGGMLFVFNSKPANPVFWMKDMQFPLDIIWISEGKIVKIDRNLPFPTPGTSDSALKQYSALQPIDYVLEVRSAFADTNSLKVGDAVVLPTL